MYCPLISLVPWLKDIWMHGDACQTQEHSCIQCEVCRPYIVYCIMYVTSLQATKYKLHI